MQKELGLQDYIDLLLRRRVIIAATLFIVLSVTTLYYLTRPPTFESSSTFMLESREIGFSEKGMDFTQFKRPVGYYRSIMKSRSFRRRIAEQILDSSEDVSDRYSRNDILEVVNSNVSLSSSEYSDFIELKAIANDPQVAYLTASIITEGIKARCQELDREELQNAVNFIEEQKRVSQTKLEDAERALQKFSEETNIVLTDEDGGILNELMNLENQLTAVQTEKELARANIAAYNRRLGQVQGGTTRDLQGTEETTEISEVRAEIARLLDQRNSMAQQYGDNFSGLKALDDQVDERRRSLVNILLNAASPTMESQQIDGVPMLMKIQEQKITEELNLYILENRERYLIRLVENYKEKHPDLIEKAMESMRLARAQKVAETLYNFLLERGEEMKIKAATGTGGIRIIDHPILPMNPIPKNMVMHILIGMLLGLGAGLSLALLKEMTDHSIRSKEDIESILDLPVMGIIPEIPSMNGKYLKLSKPGRGAGKGKDGGPEYDETEGVDAPAGRVLICNMKAKNPVVESYRSLRSNIEFATVSQPLDTMIVTSPNPSEGKTVTTANLGIAYALLGKKVLVVDADLRKPRQHKVFQMKKSPGVTDCLVGDLPLEEVIRQTTVSNLSLFTAGKSAPNPAEILSSEKMTRLMQQLVDQYDLVIYDTPPLIAVTDPMILASKVNGVIIVTKHGSTNKIVLENVVSQLRKVKTHIIGVIMNGARRSRGYGYYYYYYNRYAYYYDDKGNS